MSYCCGGWRVLQIHRSHKKLVYGIDTALVMLPLSLSPFRPLSSSSSLPFSSNTHLSSSISQVTAEQDQHQQNSRRKSSQLVALEYAELNLSNNLDMGHVRIRQHVNPLSSSFSTPAQVPDWNQVFADPALPLMVDIGCGSGRFLMWLAKRTPKVRNYLGLEIRQRMVKRAELWVKDLALDNIHFLFANAPISFKQLVESYPGPLQLVSILCPDPHFKKKHHKRRVLQKPLVGAIVDNLSPGGQVFVQSDVVEVALDMKNQFDEVDALSHIDALNSDILCDSEGWLLSNPMGIRTEREIHAEFEGGKIYRRLYEKK
ncbi:putative tRNA (guanine(46)-N(7))-methyltransferase [Medicago truncatula]|uniref:tRNA (guanine(46)-N(7))-methyltransferase n=1 Tax=Medicago truncatula TaxID=3880 RepID=A0A072TKN9_MEDTR|nr:tRNA (guanine-N(7)-)-methyltransferase [Medicago truncatula]KEH17992.1 tRNA (guanine-N(7))-methyltransferase [Medicago truncatula]RHN38815.1 putative tRNA (guanine(46)-N(7))-methyltransferase [Medicago truncatula]